MPHHLPCTQLTRFQAGRGVLIDYWSFKNKSYDPLSTHAITAADIQTIAKSQGVTFQYGDILMIRTGWTDNYSRLPQSERDKLKDIPTMEYTLVGVEQSEAMHDFLYDGYFAAVVGDQPAWEAWPPKREWGLHRSCIAMVSASALILTVSKGGVYMRMLTELAVGNANW
jgi:hypothetical protein